MADRRKVEKDIDAMIRAQFAGLETVARHPYKVWEAGFVRRWHLVPTPDTGLVQAYAAQRGLNMGSLNCVEALQMFHVHEFRIEAHQIPLWRAMEKDYDSVPQQQVEGELDPLDKKKAAQYYSDFDPAVQRARRANQVHVDFGKNSSR